MFWQINIIDSRGVQVDGVKAIGGSVNDFQSRLLLNCQVDQQGTMIQLAEALWIELIS